MTHALAIKARTFALALSVMAVCALSFVSSALAVAQDYSAVTSSASEEITAAVPVALGVAGLFVGIILAYKVLRRMIRA